MPAHPTTGSELLIVDNSDTDWKVVSYLKEWCRISTSIDIATGYFEIGSLLALEGEWQKVDHLRILMGDEVPPRTKKAFDAGLAQVRNRLDVSVEAEKERNDFLAGVPAIVEALRTGKIQCRVYRKEKFHAKAYITHSRLAVVGASALVGSSNFTFPGMAQNIELNVQITGRPVVALQEWYERHWDQAVDVTPDLLRVIERHVAEYSPFDVWACSLREFLRGHELTASEWERDRSAVYHRLAPYQQEGYHALLKKAERWRGALLCDGVGLGKTFIGMMLIERFVVHERRDVALFVPKSAREPVWEAALRKYLPQLFGKFSHLAIFNHTDLTRGGTFLDDFQSVKERAQILIVDEAHHFRNTGQHGKDEDDPRSRYWRLSELAAGKTLFLLTATPVNNRLLDLQHMIELFSQRDPAYFAAAPIGIHSLPGHFRMMEANLDRLVRGPCESSVKESSLPTSLAEAEHVLLGDQLFRTLVVQRSRAYVRRSCERHGGAILFPVSREPHVVPYSLRESYGRLLEMVGDAFHKEKPLLALAIYYPYAYFKGIAEGPEHAMREGRQRQVVSLIRTGFLKRFESSAEAFRMSCWTMLRKLLAWWEKNVESEHERHVLARWMRQQDRVIREAADRCSALVAEPEDDRDDKEDLVPPEFLEAAEKLSRDDFEVDKIIDETIADLNQLVDFLAEFHHLDPSRDAKFSALLELIRTDEALRDRKILIFTEFKDTARYLRNRLREAGIDGVDELDSGTHADRGAVIRRFAPYYNGSSSPGLVDNGEPEIRVLVSTDVLSEGLNLQDATRLVNYDIHWNPVRLMQRIGRVDRRMDPEVEARLVADHPERASTRGEIAYWNFLPPDELDTLLNLYRVVSRKTLKISKTFGIEGRKLLTPDDDYAALRDFTEAYEGTIAPEEALRLEYQELVRAHPDLENRLAALPRRTFSGRERVASGSRAVFFCYALPAPRLSKVGEVESEGWSLEAGTSQWYLYDLGTGDILNDAPRIAGFIRSTPETPRRCDTGRDLLSEVRRKVERHITNTYLKRMNAPQRVNPVLKAWMELN